MLRRKIYDELLEWKRRKGHKCLLVRGQRQVGKTYIIDYFARKNYGSYLYIDLSAKGKDAAVFDGELDVDTIISAWKVYHPRLDFSPGNTLIFLDEIQEMPRARQALKQFTLDGRYDVIASGSLIDAVNRTGDGIPSIIPVGYEEEKRMYGLDFEEFLWAKGVKQATIDHVRRMIHERTPLEEAYLEVMQSSFRDYMMVGGMPEAVSGFLTDDDYRGADRPLQDIIIQSREDTKKYAGGYEAVRIEKCFESIPSQLSESNKKFMYSRVGNGKSRSSEREFGESLLWIDKSGLGNFCYQLREPSMPLTMRKNPDQFKVYLSDTGMLAHMIGYKAREAIFDGFDGFNMGALVENEVAECITKSGYVPYYYRKNKGPDMMEIDFVIELGTELAVIEVKSGKTRNAPSIGKFDRFHRSDRRIMFCRTNIGTEDGIETYPLFAAAFLKDMQRPERVLRPDDVPDAFREKS